MLLYDDSKILSRIYGLLYQLGASPNYVGFFYIAYGVLLSLDDSRRLLAVTKLLYPEVAKYYHTNWRSVERSIRTVISVIWDTSPQQISEIAGFPLTGKPTASKFLSMLTGYYLNVYRV